MTPIPQEYESPKPAEDGGLGDGERVVISGMAGLFPDAYDVKQLSNILYNKINPVKLTTRWRFDHPELSSYTGSVPDLPYFDAQFFKVHYRLCHNMDAMARKILEQSFQAIYDAGISPEHLSGKKVGVYIGTCFSETEKAVFYVSNSRTGFGIAGCNKSMFANRISYWLNAKGPSMSVDVSCCSSTAALETAYLAISRGDCEAAIVGGGNLCLHPHSSVHYGRLTKISKDGITKSFDECANGCAKSEAINVLFLQKAKNALRIYADVVHIKCEYTALDDLETGDPKFGFYRKHDDTLKFMKRFYDEANVSPDVVEYVEAFGSAAPEADKAELDAIDEVYCKNRKKPLLVGSVMSNIGYGEAASGISAVTKVLLGYHHGKLAANLHCDSPRQDVSGVRDGRIQIVQEHQEFNRTYTAINGLSVTGVNAHILLHGRYKPKDLNRYKASIPRLVLLSGRQETSVKKIIEDMKCRRIDPEEHALLHNIHETTIKGHLGRGYVLLDTDAMNNTVTLSEGCDYFDQAKRPLCFVYSGMGSQWAGMGKALMRIPIFAAAIEKCRRVLEPKGVDIVNIITSDDKTMFDNILHSFVGIAAIQIALTDILRELEIFPDMIIGHSVGELGCAYADGCFTAEEMILSAYSRGLVSIQTPFIRGSMAAVGLGYREVIKLCPPEIEVACRNASDSSTISGPADIMSEFVASLTKKNIFAKEVPCSNIAYHSRYIADAGPGLLKYLSEVIKSPKARSARWVSTSVPQDRWDEPLAKYSSAEYHTNNLLNPVLFEETSKLIPSNAMVIEVAPHGLLQAIMKRSLPESCCLLPLTRRGHSDNVRFLLDAIGRLSMEGFNPKVKELYPKIQFPVSTGTPMLSHLVEWAHNEKWSLALYATANRKLAAAAKYILSVYDDEHAYLKGHVLRGKNLYPFAGALVCVWDTFAMSLSCEPKKLSVQFRDVYLYTQPILHEQRQLHLTVSLHRGSGKFEILNDDAVIAEGYIFENATLPKESDNCSFGETNVSAKDVYQMLHARDYNYEDDFRSIHCADESLTRAKLIWKNNWITFIDGILQFNVLRRNHETISKLNFIQNLEIDVDKHNADANLKPSGVNLINANISDVCDITTCGGITLRSIKFIDLPELNRESLTISSLKFSPFFTSDILDETTALHIHLQIVADNIKKERLNILQIADNVPKSGFSGIEYICNNIPGIHGNYSKLKKEDILRGHNQFITNVDLLLVTNLSSDEKMCQILYNVLGRDTFLINKELSITTSPQPCSLYEVVSAHKIGNAKLELVIWRPTKANTSSLLTIRSPKDLSHLTSTGTYGSEYYLPLEDEFDVKNEKILRNEHIGNLSSLQWAKAKSNDFKINDVKVHYAGINMLEVNRQLGINLNADSNQNKIEMDFSGITSSGDRVMGVVQSEAIMSHVEANTEFLWPIPKHWSLEDAATVPLAYSMGFYILCYKANLSAKHIILVHGGAGALGQAIISIALANGCQVFTTVSTMAKKRFLRKLFPELKDENIGNSRDTSFGDLVLTKTGGNGCDIAISCVKGEKKNVTLKSLGPTGRFFDVSGIRNRDDFNFGMNNLIYDRSYFLVDFSCLFKPEYLEISKHVQVLVSEGIARGYVRPLSRITFAPQDVTRAFRLLAASRHRGRVLLDMQQLVTKVQPRIICSPDSWHLLTSDNESFGLKLADKLVNKGARKLLLLMNNPSKCVDVKLRLWQKNGLEIKLITNNIWSESNVLDIIQSLGEDIESVFIINSNNSDNLSLIVNSISAVKKKLNIPLKHFALVSAGDASKTQTSLRRPNDSNLTEILLPAVKMVDVKDSTVNRSAISLNSAVNVLESALCYKHSTVLVNKCHSPNQSLFQQLLKIAEIGNEVIPMDAPLELTLKDLNIDISKAHVLQVYLRDVYEVNLTPEKILHMTIKEINDIEKDLTVNLVDTDGLGSYFSRISDDELMSTTNIVFLPTLTANTTKRNDEFDLCESYLCIIPGVEGHHSRFTEMCKRLKIPALVLQPELDWKNENIQQLAERYLGILKKKAELKETFTLLGYESGVLVALEMAAILEEKGLTGCVYCIGGSPAEVVADFKYKLRGYKTNEQLQIAVLKHMYTLISGENSDQLDSLLNDNMDWDEKLHVCVNTLLGRISHSIQYAQQLIKSSYERVTHVLQYTPKQKLLRSKIISLRPQYSTEVESSVNIDPAYKATFQYQLQAPLSLATLDFMCAAIINRHLGADILEQFNKKNHCDTYIMNADSFMSIEH